MRGIFSGEQLVDDVALDGPVAEHDDAPPGGVDAVENAFFDALDDGADDFERIGNERVVDVVDLNEVRPVRVVFLAAQRLIASVALHFAAGAGDKRAVFPF